MSALIVNQKFAGLTAPFRATHSEMGEGIVQYIKPNGKKVYFVPKGAGSGKFVKLTTLSHIVVQYRKMFGALTGFQARHLKNLYATGQTTLEYFSKKKHGGKWKRAKRPTWDMTTNYRVILH